MVLQWRDQAATRRGLSRGEARRGARGPATAERGARGQSPRLNLNMHYVLEGRVVTMAAAGVIADGAIYVADGRIVAVQHASVPAPDGFAHASRIRTGDTIYPGLIELHNHLSYNAMPLWDVPQRYTNNGQWKNHEDYRRLITKPSQTLGRTDGVVQALVRYVECRCLLGATTTSQGVTLASAGGIRKFYRGVVRNVEQPLADDLPAAGTKIANPGTGEAAARAYLDRLDRQTCYLQHLSEGTDATARGWFHRLRLPDGTWALNDAFCGIHSTALTEADLAVIHEHGGSIVWSPLSNYLLYGRTLDLQAAKNAGVPIGLGSDWAPSGSKNMLGELKVAWLANQAQGSPFTARELVEMATVNGARILQWLDQVGTIEAGRRADLVALDGQQGDDYARVIEARESSVTLVVIDGVPRVGQRRLMRRFDDPSAFEAATVGRSSRLLDLRPQTEDELVRDLPLAEAIARLGGAMLDLPRLAADLDRGVAGPFGGALDTAGTGWRVVMDLDDDDEFQLGALPLADWVQPMVLDPLTVVDDERFLPRLAAARNLPEFVKEGLPPLYGERVPTPAAAEFLLGDPQDFEEVIATTRELKTLLRTWGELTLADRRRIVDQATLLIEHNYVHLPLKRAMHAVDPVQRLRLLRQRLDETTESDMGPEMEFHDELVDIFRSLRDLHTVFRLPRPFRDKVAWLPFLVEEFWEHGHRRLLVSKVIGQPGPLSFERGVELLYWNGVPAETAIERNADRQAGSNVAARWSRGLNSMTLRPLSHGSPPDEEWVTLTYRGLDGEVYEYSQEWLVFRPGHSAGPGAAAAPPTDTALALDPRTDEIQEARKTLFGARMLGRERAALARGDAEPLADDGDGVIPTFMPTVLRARHVEVDGVAYGHLRIFSFNVVDHRAFVHEFVRLVEQMPIDGLMLDVRGNGGGVIFAAERVLQVLTPHRITPERAQFINSALNLSICEHNVESPFPGLTLRRWVPSIRESVMTGATYSLGYPITSEDDCNDIGQRYYGPVALVTDALCYSATDMLAAGFQDHQIGPIVGVHGNTGAGGANVWSHDVLRTLLPSGGADPASPYRPLPHGADLRVAIRRTTRVGPNAGGVVEDLGVSPDVLHEMTRRDLLESNVDLMRTVAAQLAARRPHLLTLKAAQTGRLRVGTRHVNRIDPVIDGRPRGSFDVRGRGLTLELEALLGRRPRQPVQLELLGYDDDRLVASLRRELPPLDP